MPAIAAIAIQDGQPTPVTRTFSPLAVSSDMIATYENRASGQQLAFDALSIGFRRANASNQNNKVTVRLTLPTLEATTPPTPATKAYDCFVSVDFVLPTRSSEQDRKNLVTLLRNALAASGTIDTVVRNLESVY